MLSIQGKNSLQLTTCWWVSTALFGPVEHAMGSGGARDADLELATAKYPRIRLITVPNVGTQEPQKDFRGSWQPCRRETAAGFSAVGYFFGRQLHQTRMCRWG